MFCKNATAKVVFFSFPRNNLSDIFSIEFVLLLKNVYNTLFYFAVWRIIINFVG